MSKQPDHDNDTDPNRFDDEPLPPGVVLKEHAFDGIREYDQRLPRWWLITLYGAIAFSIVYWLVNHFYSASLSDTQRVDRQLAHIETLRLQSSIDVTDNELFREMSRNSAFVTAGASTYQSTCAACHGAKLEGGIGVNLVDGEWLHGGTPADIYTSIFGGIPDKGMQAWGTLLGQRRITEVVAYIISENPPENIH